MSRLPEEQHWLHKCSFCAILCRWNNLSPNPAKRDRNNGALYSYHRQRGYAAFWLGSRVKSMGKGKFWLPMTSKFLEKNWTWHAWLFSHANLYFKPFCNNWSSYLTVIVRSLLNFANRRRNRWKFQCLTNIAKIWKSKMADCRHSENGKYAISRPRIVRSLPNFASQRTKRTNFIFWQIMRKYEVQDGRRRSFWKSRTMRWTRM